MFDYKVFVVIYVGFGGLVLVEMFWYEKIKVEFEVYIWFNNLINFILIGYSMGGNLVLDLGVVLL